MIELSLIIPCYNEAQNLPRLLERLQELLKQKQNIEIILVDNGSTDTTAEALTRLIADSPFKDNLAICQVPVNQGYGHGILQGLAMARGRYLGWTHADMQTDPMDAITAWDTLMQAPEPDRTIVKGHRRQRPLVDTMFTVFMQWICTVALKTPLSDINAQPKVFSRRIYEAFQNPPQDFSLDLYLLFLGMRHYTVQTIPVYFNKRLYGEAKGGGSLKTKWRLSRRTFRYIVELRQKLIKEMQL